MQSRQEKTHAAQIKRLLSPKQSFRGITGRFTGNHGKIKDRGLELSTDSSMAPPSTLVEFIVRLNSQRRASPASVASPRNGATLEAALSPGLRTILCKRYVGELSFLTGSKSSQIRGANPKEIGVRMITAAISRSGLNPEFELRALRKTSSKLKFGPLFRSLFWWIINDYQPYPKDMSVFID